MSHYGTPVIFAILTGILVQYNATHETRQLLLPLIDVVFPAEADDMHALGRRSIQGAGVLTVLATLWAVVGHARAIAARSREAAAKD